MASIINATVTSPGGLVSTGDNTNELKIQTGETDALTVSSSQVVTFNKPIVVGTNTINAENSLGFRNRIINGDMRIDQRNAGASVTPTGAAYTLDRWNTNLTVASKFSVQQNAGSVTPPVGFTNYLGVTSLSAYSVSSTDFFSVLQSIEGFNTADLSWGTANAQPVTVSFWVRSSLTGTFGGSLNNSGFTRSYPFAYTINSANTWEQKTITVLGDTTGTWLTNNSTGLHLYFNLGAGSTRSNTAGSWVGSLAVAPTGATSVVGTNGATFYITGVQLEVGSVATPFERLDYGRQLIQCQRYFSRLKPLSGNYVGYGAGVIQSSASATIATLYFKYPTSVRATPTISQNSTAVWDGITQNAVISLGSIFYGTDSAQIDLNLTSSGTAGRAFTWNSNNTTSAYVDISAEL